MLAFFAAWLVIGPVLDHRILTEFFSDTFCQGAPVTSEE
jgi:hypothetical protein